MVQTKYAILVEAAKKRREEHLNFALEEFTFDSLSNLAITPILVQELDAINKHITVVKEVFDSAKQDYEEISASLVQELGWPEGSINIKPQGSSSTQTLIRAPNRSKFDIDAVCAVDISLIEAKQPMTFYNSVGEALLKWEPIAKKRCWTIKFPNRDYYIEFTPSVPLSTVSLEVAESIRYSPSNRYEDTALAVVDTPTEQWKTSNPEGFTCWVSDQAKRIILIPLIAKSLSQESAIYDSVDPVPDQEIPLSDTLRIAIRLLKRHRDMSVQRGMLEKEYKPISVIIVTLLTQCYEGLADQGSHYRSALKLLTDLVGLMPLMVEFRNGEYWIENPTVQGENFAEKWNENSKRRDTFYSWCELLAEDFQDLLSTSDEKLLSEKLRKVFGCTAASTPPSSGLAAKAPSRVHAVPAGTGLA